MSAAPSYIGNVSDTTTMPSAYTRRRRRSAVEEKWELFERIVSWFNSVVLSVAQSVFVNGGETLKLVEEVVEGIGLGLIWVVARHLPRENSLPFRNKDKQSVGPDMKSDHKTNTNQNSYQLDGDVR